ncbi:Gas vesicle synthesis protein GvpL/GvpF [Desulfotomaculum arcticum]|uniref:Gas vesicle synthesis protein GvpL/GvpF n=1 Tax=Desulfotruncus arcticus DSM 17038 TaxID=1121424 RepID=A0A1I2VHT6_9FIRM|nr:GvpL/GvpF family gas vesicle protein [Desulfotruncus arcticus]SFG88653.1 Gas vesicle synthesis protein GvpL/GvpF [Desulfotomaculum arcticum] [Desulfotruncus arcticus DSM 17038]
MKQLNREEKELLKTIFFDRLNKEVAQIENSAWERAAAQCQDFLTNVFTELLLEHIFAANNKTINKLVPENNQDSPATDQEKKTETDHRLMESRPEKDRQAKSFIYLYCIAPLEAALMLKNEIVPGLPDGGSVRSVEYGNIAAIVSSVPVETYSEDVLEELVKNLDWLESRVTRHEEIIQYVAEHFPVIPMKFCTIFHTHERVRQLLSHKESDFNNMLASLKGKEEWGLKIYYQPAQLSRYVARNSALIQETKGMAEAKGAGAAYFIRKKMDDLLAEEMENTATQIAGYVNTELAPYVAEGKINRLLGSEITGRLETMALNAVYLVGQSEINDFKQRVVDLSEKYQNLGFDFALTGPWPPYNFSSFSDLEGGGENEQLN